MAEPSRSSGSLVASFLAIGLVVAGGAAAFAYTAGWLSPERLTPAKVTDAFAPPGGPALGHRRNHSKGVCVSGYFEANGRGASLSTAPMLAVGKHPFVGRLNLATVDPNAADGSARVRGLGIRIIAADGQEWRSAMIDAPFFAVSTPQAFFELLKASAKADDPDAMKAFVAAHPEFAAFGAWAKTSPRTASYAEERFNGLNSFIFTNASGERKAVRWSLIPEAQPTTVAGDDLEKRDADFLSKDITDRVVLGPVRWTVVVQVADPGDPTADPSKAWPEERRKVEIGVLVADKVTPEPDGPCRDVNFDPTVLPAGMSTSDDPFPAARSAVYAVSYDRRAAEAAHYPAESKAK